MACCFGLLVSTFSLNLTSVSAEQINPSSSEQTLADTYFEEYLEETVFNEENDYYKILLAIEALPAGIEKQGAEKIAQWLSKKSGIEVIAEGDYLSFPTLQNPSNEEISTYSSLTDWATCLGAAGMAALSNALPIAKVTKIKSTFKALGGVTTAVKQIYTNFKYYRGKNYSVKTSLDNAITDIVNKEKLGTDARQALLEFFGVSAVYGACGDLFSYKFNEEALKAYSV